VYVEGDELNTVLSLRFHSPLHLLQTHRNDQPVQDNVSTLLQRLLLRELRLLQLGEFMFTSPIPHRVP